MGPNVERGHFVVFLGKTVMTQTLTSPRLINGYRPANETWAGLEFNPGRGEGWQKYPYSLHAVGPEIMPWPDGALDSDTDTIPASGRVQVHFNTRLLDNNSGSNHGSYFPPESSLPCTDVQKLTPRKSNDLSSKYQTNDFFTGKYKNNCYVHIVITNKQSLGCF